jgi:L-threonylcarbamoyladenylate synthase
LESTVVDLSPSTPRLLRPGLIAPGEIDALIGPIERNPTRENTADQPLRSPGLLCRHYAPRAVLETAEDGSDRVAQLCRQGAHVGWLTFEVRPLTANARVIVMPRKPPDYAARLYAALHELDEAGVDRIVVSLPPDTEEWATVLDRLRRAAQSPGS